MMAVCRMPKTHSVMPPFFYYLKNFLSISCVFSNYSKRFDDILSLIFTIKETSFLSVIPSTMW